MEILIFLLQVAAGLAVLVAGYIGYMLWLVTQA